MTQSIHFVSLGCARNQVDSEEMTGRLLDAGWQLCDDAARADAIVVNTCSFVEAAVNESIDTILALAEHKSTGRCRQLVVVGCLPERFRGALKRSLPEVDCFLGTGAFDDIAAAVSGQLGSGACRLPDPGRPKSTQLLPQRIHTGAPSAYLKIAEGCSRKCTYCIIPKLRGRQQSVPTGQLVAQARQLTDAGVRELVLVAQESTHYGHDLKPASHLGALLETLATELPDTWLRVLYGHPASIDEPFLAAVAAHPNICAYFDVPIQHVGDRMLRRMGRQYTQEHLQTLFSRIRQALPDAALRTTLITGFPGEGESDFKQMLDFVAQIEFDHLGVFTYSGFDDLPSHRLSDPVPADIARQRRDEIMACQQEISARRNQRHRGCHYPVLVEEVSEPNVGIGRTMFQAPEVDGVTYVHAEHLRPGDRPVVHITDSMEYDLVGAVA